VLEELIQEEIADEADVLRKMKIARRSSLK
jgi:hypothetical protein